MRRNRRGSLFACPNLSPAFEKGEMSRKISEILLSDLLFLQ